MKEKEVKKALVAFWKKQNMPHKRVVCKKSRETELCDYFDVSIDGVPTYEALVYKDETYGIVYYHVPGTNEPEDWKANTTRLVGLYLGMPFLPFGS